MFGLEITKWIPVHQSGPKRPNNVKNDPSGCGLRGGGPNSYVAIIIGNKSPCLSLKRYNKGFQDAIWDFHWSPCCFFLPQIPRCRLKFSCWYELKLVNTRRHFAPFLATWYIAQLHNCIVSLSSWKTNSSGLCKAITPPLVRSSSTS